MHQRLARRLQREDDVAISDPETYTGKEGLIRFHNIEIRSQVVLPPQMCDMVTNGFSQN